jgi:hypothetical protein
MLSVIARKSLDIRIVIYRRQKSYGVRLGASIELIVNCSEI